MDFSNRGNRPSGQQQQQQSTAPREQNQTTVSETPRRSSNMGGGMSPSKLSSLFVVLGGAVLVAAIIALLIFGSGGENGNKETDLIKQDQYQAVFLDSQDGQVYFGKLEVFNKELYALTDIYYVRVENPIQPQGDEPQAPNISLAKLGNELHGPEDVMFVARDKILYWENLKDDGQVVTAISEFKANGGQSAQPQQGQDQSQQQTQPAGTEEVDDTTGTETPETP